MRAIAILGVVMVSACSTYAYQPARGPARAPVSVLAGVDEPIINGQRRNPLAWQDIAVRHRRQVSPWNPLALFSGLGLGGTPAAAPVAATLQPAVADDAKIVIEIWLTVQTDEVARTAGETEAWARGVGGRVVSSNIVGAGAATSAALELRVPPARVGELASWIRGRGSITSQRTLGSDVGKAVLDHELELRNLKLEMTRLEELAKRDGPLEQLLAVERELTRVRGQIERVEGELQFLADRVELATLNVTLARDIDDTGVDEPVPRARLHPGAHVALLSLLDPGAGPRTRLGGGVTIALRRSFTLDLDVFPRAATDTRAVVATAGTATYASSFGYGRRRFFNPYLGARAGYGYLGGHGALVLAGELGVELLRRRELVIEVAARALAVFADPGTEAALQTQLGVTVPF